MKNTFKKVALVAAEEAGNILRRHFGKVKDIGFKGRIDIVTDVDRRSEDKVVSILRKHFPDHGILAEEGNEIKSDSPYKWLIDPLDGTTNYAHSYPIFCVSIALEYKGVIILGVVYNPVMDELFTAEKGKGAYFNKKRIRVSKINKLQRSLLVTGFPYAILKKSKVVFKIFELFSLNCQGIRRDGSAALNLCYTACGRFEGFWESELNPWDTAAGYLIAKEAGAVITDYARKPFSCYKNEILASNGRIHKAMIGIIRKGSKAG
ncbi:inositol monophosphatase family protein [Candidatus Auribacterota bacterium]